MAAESPSSPPPSSPPPPTPLPPQPQQQYWCHHCEKRVSTETLPDQSDVICTECKFGFVETVVDAVYDTVPTIATTPLSPPSLSPDLSGIDEPTLGSQFLHVLRLLAQVARDDHPEPPPPPPPPRASSSDFLRIEIDSWPPPSNNNGNGDGDEERDDGEEEEDEDDVRSVEIEGESNDDDDDDDDEERDDEEDERRRQRRDVLRLRLRDFATRARSGGGRNRILDWAEILMGLEDNSIEFRFEVPATEDRYVGDPGDYVDAAEYDALLQNLADAEGRRGAPPASKAAIEGLKEVEIRTDSRMGYEEGSYVCAICKDGVSVGDVVKEMPCGHGYHGDCIVPWLAARNSCPICRFELPTDDPEYEEDKRKRSSGDSASGGGGGGNVGSSTVGSSSVA